MLLANAYSSQNDSLCACGVFHAIIFTRHVKKKQWKYPVVSQQIENGKVKMIVGDLTQTNGKCARILERTFYLREQ